jgi:hypothetical protein
METMTLLKEGLKKRLKMSLGAVRFGRLILRYIVEF